MEYVGIAKILFVFFVALVSPGPDFLMVSSMSLARGRSDGIRAAAGTTVGIAVYTTICLMGLSALFTHYAGLTTAIKLCGGLYLAYIGVALWRSSLAKKEDGGVPSIKVGKKSAFWTGALTTLTNAKAVAFFASIFSLILTPELGLGAKVFIGVAIPLENFLWFSFVAFCLSNMAVRAKYERAKRAIDASVGTVLGFFGLKLVFEAVADLRG